MRDRQPLRNALLAGAVMTLICASGSAASPGKPDGGEPGGAARDDTAKQGGDTGQAADPGVWADTAAEAGPANQGKPDTLAQGDTSAQPAAQGKAATQGKTAAQSEAAAQGATAAQDGTQAQSDTVAQGETAAQSGSTAGAADGEETQASRAVSEPQDRGPDLEWVAKQNRETTELNKKSVARMRENMSESKSGS